VSQPVELSDQLVLDARLAGQATERSIAGQVAFLQRAAPEGYTVVLCFIGLAGPEVSADRVAMRVSQGGHDVPSAKLVSRFPRTMANLRRAVAVLPHVLVFDNDDLAVPFRFTAEFASGRVVQVSEPLPEWLRGFTKV